LPHALVEEFHSRPSVAAYMARAFLPSPGLGPGATVPSFVARWPAARIDRRRLRSFLAMTGLSAEDGVPLLYPHVFAFPLLMALLTRRAYPLPIWNALQIRNQLLGRRRITVDEPLDLETRVAGQRVLAKGIEVDLHTTLSGAGETAWESVVTFYYRGRFGRENERSPLADAPEVEGPEIARWRTPVGGGLRFGRLTGDYNGIHWSRAYARHFGFDSALLHPQRVLGQCLARLARPVGEGQRLDAWLKGPVYYDRDVCLRCSSNADGERFALSTDGETRASIVGRRGSVPAGASLLDERDRPLPFPD
jgi:hypothetical protein